MNSEANPEEMEKRKQWFDSYIHQLENHSVVAPRQQGISYHCPCCGYRTLQERGGYDICPVCFWEDDGQDNEGAEIVRGGPNGALSLIQARANFQEFGACDKQFMKNVRQPLPEGME